MADLVAQILPSRISKQPDFVTKRYVVGTSEAAALFGGALADLKTFGGDAGLIVHGDDADMDRIQAGLVMPEETDVENGAAATESITIGRGLVIHGLRFNTGAPTAADEGRAMYQGIDDNEIVDFANATAGKQRFVGWLYPDKTGAMTGLYIPAVYPGALAGIEERFISATITGANQAVLESVVGLKDVFNVIPTLDEAAPGDGMSVHADPGVGGALVVSVYTAAGAAATAATVRFQILGSNFVPLA